MSATTSPRRTIRRGARLAMYLALIVLAVIWLYPIAVALYQSVAAGGLANYAAVLNHPAHGPAWLANKLAPYGEYLEAGEIVLGGSFTAPVFARPGDTFSADYGPFGTITCYFK